MVKIIKVNGCHDFPIVPRQRLSQKFIRNYPSTECLEIHIKGFNADVSEYIKTKTFHPYCLLPGEEEHLSE